jgi:branched-chain amino acid transport system substrate-binding protein
MTWLAAAAICAAAAAPALAADTIKIGVQGAHSGDLASYGVPSLNAVKIVVEKANAAGGVLGRKIEIIAQDDQCKPEMATNAATKLISDKAVAVIGPICSGPTKAALPLFQQANIIAISPTATTPGLTEDGKNPLFFRTVANERPRPSSPAISCSTSSRQVCGLPARQRRYGKALPTKTRHPGKAGVKTVLFEAVTPDAVDFSPVCANWHAPKPDILVFGANRLGLQAHPADAPRTPEIAAIGPTV